MVYIKVAQINTQYYANYILFFVLIAYVLHKLLYYKNYDALRKGRIIMANTTNKSSNISIIAPLSGEIVAL